MPGGNSFFYFDIYYIILVLPAVIIAIIAQFNVKNSFNKYSKIYSSNGISAKDVTRKILDANGLRHIRIEQVSGSLTDHFDPKAQTIRLSSSVYNSTSVASIGVAAHEAGHAIQYSKEYAPIKLRSGIVKLTQFSSMLCTPMIFLGLLWPAMSFFINLGLVLFLVTVLFQLITLPVEFDASKRALSILEKDYILANDELKGAKKVLSAAALTYVAALLVSLMSFLRLLLIVRNRND